MTEAEATEALVDIAMNCATFFSVCISLTFAFLTVAYFIGSALTRFQLILISAIYAVAELMMGMTFVIWVEAFERLHSREKTILSDIWLLKPIAWSQAGAVLLFAVFLASIYFMYDIRKRANI
jgi:hypothetical protein